MGSYSSEKISVPIDLKGHAISFGNPCLPDKFMPFHFLNMERRMFRVIEKVHYLFVYLFLDVFRKPFIIPFKGFCEGDLHFFKALMASEALENGPDDFTFFYGFICLFFHLLPFLCPEPFLIFRH